MIYLELGFEVIMTHLSRNPSANKALFRLIYLVLGWTLTGCTYRFSNSFQRGTYLARSVCVESIYSTAKEVLPYHHLWDSIQRRIALDGTFFVDSCEFADVVIVGHLFEGSTRPSGEAISTKDAKQDPKTYDPVAPDPTEFRRLESAREVIRGQEISYTLRVDAHDLRTRAMLFSKVYGRAEKFLPLEHAQITKKQQFPMAEEGLSNRSRAISTDIASRVVSDLRSALIR
jgi:hypothetical protein